MGVTWRITYRGPLSSCNYACGYCPFAKRTNTREEMADDRSKLERFVDWVAAHQQVEMRVLFTPWGEAAIHSYYQAALRRLGDMPHVRRVCIQTNLSGSLTWLDTVNSATVGLWATWHPTEVDLETFLTRCSRVRARGVPHSVGAVGLREHAEAIEHLRRQLPHDVYVWVNAYKDRPDYYDRSLIERFTAVDPLFPLNLRTYASRGHACDAGETSFAVDGDGHITRCHFVKEHLGNIYDAGFAEALRARACPATTCACHIGYVHLKRLNAERHFGAGYLERIPDPDSLRALTTFRGSSDVLLPPVPQPC